MNHADLAQLAPVTDRESWDVIVFFGDGTKECSNMPRYWSTSERMTRMARIVAWLKRRHADVCWIELVETFPAPHMPRERLEYPVQYSRATVRAADKEEWTWRG